MRSMTTEFRRRFATWQKLWQARFAPAAGLSAALLLAACATPADPYSVAPAATQIARNDAVGDCLRRLKALDARIDAAGRRDAQAARVPRCRRDHAPIPSKKMRMRQCTMFEV